MSQISGTAGAANGAAKRDDAGGLGPKAWDSLYILRGPDLDLLRSLGAEPPAQLEHAKEICLAEVRLPLPGHEHTPAASAIVRISVTAMPAKFWRFDITSVEGNTYTLHSASGRLSDYWQTIKLFAFGLVVIGGPDQARGAA